MPDANQGASFFAKLNWGFCYLVNVTTQCATTKRSKNTSIVGVNDVKLVDVTALS